MPLIFLSSGLFLGWSLGANDAANIFGTAVGSRMIRFRTAALICGAFVILGAVISGAGVTRTLGALGSVDTIAGAFVVALCAGLSVFWMSRLKMPVSTSQAIIGALIGWNFYAGAWTDYTLVSKIVATWLLCPVLAALFSLLLFTAFRAFFNRANIHLLRMDMFLRVSLVVGGAFGAYSLGANNIANVMGVFVPVSPFDHLQIGAGLTLTSAQVLYFIGGVSIAVGVYTYSGKVMETVGSGILRLSPEAALVVVVAHGLVLFLFASMTLKTWLLNAGLPTVPLVPVSSTQAVVGGVLGIGLLKGARNINFGMLGGIAAGWLTTPVVAGLLTFFALFVVQNVFKQKVSEPHRFEIDDKALTHLAGTELDTTALAELGNRKFDDAQSLRAAAQKAGITAESELKMVAHASEVLNIQVDADIIDRKLKDGRLSEAQLRTLESLVDQSFKYRWQLADALRAHGQAWRLKRNSKRYRVDYNDDIVSDLNHVIRVLRRSQDG